VKVISYLLMAFFSVMLIALIPLGTILFSANSTFLKPYHSEAYLADSGIYTNIKQMIKNKITGEDKQAHPSALEKLKVKLVGQAFDKVVTDDFVSKKLGLLQTNIWDYLTDKTNTFMTVPVTELSNILLKFPSEQLGDHNDLAGILGLKLENMEKIKTSYKLAQKGLWVLYILIFILLGLCVLLTYILSISGKWLGISLIIGALLTLLLCVPIWLSIDKIHFSTDMEELKSSITILILRTRHDYLQCLSIVSITILALGILMMFMKKRQAASPMQEDQLIA
jgi:hypothetical protein